MAGDAQTGVSIMRLTAGLDSGPVCLVGIEPIRPDDTYGSLAARLEGLGGELIVRALEEHPPFAEQPQEGVTYAEKISAEDRLLDPRPLGRRARARRARSASAHRGAGRATRRHRARRSARGGSRHRRRGWPAAERSRRSGPGCRQRGARRGGETAARLPRGRFSSCSRCSRPAADRWTPPAYLRGHGPPGRR